MFLGIIKDFFKLLNKKVVPLYLWIFLYSFSSSIEDNFFICSYLRDEVFGKDENTTLVLVFYIIYSLILFYTNKIKNKNKNIKYITLYTKDFLTELLTLRYKFYILVNTSINHIILFTFSKFYLFLIFLINNYKSYKINTFFIFFIRLIKLTTLIWYPIFKAYSIFGFFKSTRLNFIDLKNENLKRLKS